MPEQVVGLALHGLGARVEVEQRVDHRVGLGNLNPDPHPPRLAQRQQVDHYLEPLGCHPFGKPTARMAQVVDAAQVRAHLEPVVAIAGDHSGVLVTGGEDHLLVRTTGSAGQPSSRVAHRRLAAGHLGPGHGHRGSPTLRAMTGLRFGVPTCTASGRSGVHPDVTSSPWSRASAVSPPSSLDSLAAGVARG